MKHTPRAHHQPRHVHRIRHVFLWGLVVGLALVVVTFGPTSARVARWRNMVRYRLQTNWTAPAAAQVRLAVPFHRQEHALSCEIAALKMVLNYAGVAVTETELLEQLPFATTDPRSRDNTWGDPDVGFVGNIDGKIPNTGYGVYEAPIVALAQQYRPARVLTGASLTELLEEVAAGHPVIVWGTLSSGRDISWTTPEGKPVKAIYGEHTRVVVGFSGTPAVPQTIFLLDPIYGPITMLPSRFVANWELLDRKAVVVE